MINRSKKISTYLYLIMIYKEFMILIIKTLTVLQIMEFDNFDKRMKILLGKMEQSFIEYSKTFCLKLFQILFNLFYFQR